MRIQEQVSLAEHTTFGIGGPARFFTEAETEQDVAEALAWTEARGLPLFILGGGSNLLVSDAGFDGLVVRMAIRGVQQEGALFDVGAGEVWDEFVQRAVDADFAGIECMAGIPGSVGGTPVQNVGAYGQEVAETIASVRALDRTHGRFCELTPADCRFRYRKSLFNSDEPGRYVVTRVRYRLHPAGQAQVTYSDIKRHFAYRSENPELKDVAYAVRAIRRDKGMLIVKGDPDCRSAGSFFRNPVVLSARTEEIAAAAGVSAESLPHWPAGADELTSAVKLSAAWLIERSGFGKGFVDGAAGISSRHTLALINRGDARAADIERLQDRIVAAVRSKFGVELEREPVMVGGTGRIVARSV